MRKFASRIRRSDITQQVTSALVGITRRPLAMLIIASAFVLYYSVSSNSTDLSKSVLGWLKTEYGDNAVIGAFVKYMYDNAQKTVGLGFQMASIISAASVKFLVLYGGAAAFIVYDRAILTYPSYFYHAAFVFLILRLRNPSTRAVVALLWFFALEIITKVQTLEIDNDSTPGPKILTPDTSPLSTSTTSNASSACPPGTIDYGGVCFFV